jgi:hypothetical protein
MEFAQRVRESPLAVLVLLVRPSSTLIRAFVVTAIRRSVAQGRSDARSWSMPCEEADVDVATLVDVLQKTELSTRSSLPGFQQHQALEGSGTKCT